LTIFSTFSLRRSCEVFEIEVIGLISLDKN
jgi:hypothetical protein